MKKVALEYAEACGNDAKSYRYFEVPRATFYRWKKAYALAGEAGLLRKKPVGRQWPSQLSQLAIDKILHLRQKYHLGPQRIAWYLERYYGISASCSTVYRTLIRNGMRQLSKKVGRRALHTRRYTKRVPGHHI